MGKIVTISETIDEANVYQIPKGKKIDIEIYINECYLFEKSLLKKATNPIEILVQFSLSINYLIKLNRLEGRDRSKAINAAVFFLEQAKSLFKDQGTSNDLLFKKHFI